MYRQHRFDGCQTGRRMRQRGGEVGRVHGEMVWVDVDQHRGRTNHFHGRNGRDRGVRHGGHRAPGSDAEAAQGEDDGVRAIAAAHRLARAQPSREFRLERLHFLAEDVPAGLKRARDGGVDFRFEGAVARARIGGNDHR